MATRTLPCRWKPPRRHLELQSHRCHSVATHSMPLCYVVLGLLIYAQSAFSQTCGTDFSDVPSRTVLADIVFVGHPLRHHVVDSDLERVNILFAVTDVYKGELPQNASSYSDDLESVAGNNSDVMYLPVMVGTFGHEDRLNCIAPPVFQVTKLKNYIVFLHGHHSGGSGRRGRGSRRNQTSASAAAATGSSSASTQAVYRISSFPEPYSKRTIEKVREFTCSRCGKKPVVNLTAESLEVKVNEKFNLTCRATSGKPIPVFKWYKDGVLLRSDRRIRIRTSKQTSRLQIKQAEVEDAGVYQCIAENVLGSANASVQIAENIPFYKAHASPCRKQGYCFNGGTCYVLDGREQKFCHCHPNREGERCELKKTGFRTNSKKLMKLHGKFVRRK